MPASTCPVCAEEHVALRRPPVPCPGCEYRACAPCARRFLGERADAGRPAACMACAAPWDEAHVAARLSRSFAGELARRARRAAASEAEVAGRAAARADEELARAVREAEEEAAAARRRHGDARESFLSARLLHTLARARLREAVGVGSREERAAGAAALRDAELRLADRRAACRLRRFELGEARRALREAWEAVRSPGGGPSGSSSSSPPPPPPPAVAPCAWPDCNGRVAADGACRACGRATCTRCRAAGGPRHACDPAALADLEAIRRDSKPCPGCGALIHRTEGCDAMHCVLCRETFHWSTGLHADPASGLYVNEEYDRWARTPEGRARTAAAAAPAGAADPVATLAAAWPDGPNKALALGLLRYGRYAARRLAPAARAGDPSADRALRVRFLLGRVDAKALGRAAGARADEARARAESAGILEALGAVCDDIAASALEGRPLGECLAELKAYAAVHNEAIEDARRRLGARAKLPGAIDASRGAAARCAYEAGVRAAPGERGLAVADA